MPQDRVGSSIHLPAERMCAAGVVGDALLAEPEICQSYVPISVEQHVFWLQIPDDKYGQRMQTAKAHHNFKCVSGKRICPSPSRMCDIKCSTQLEAASTPVGKKRVLRLSGALSSIKGHRHSAKHSPLGSACRSEGALCSAGTSTTHVVCCGAYVFRLPSAASSNLYQTFAFSAFIARIVDENAPTTGPTMPGTILHS